MSRPAHRRLPAFLCFLALAVPLAACGGAGGGAGPGGAGQGLVLMSFVQDGFDNSALNTVLRFEFSEDVDPSTVSAAAIQIRQGPSFGENVAGVFLIQGSTVLFEPRLPGHCDLSDGGLQPDTDYRVQIVGFPEEFAVRNTHGQPLRTTDTFSFHTRSESDPDTFLDEVPAVAPTVLLSSPSNGAEAVAVAPGNQVVLTLSENVDPCTVTEANVRLHVYQIGDKTKFTPARGGTGNASGFASPGGITADLTPGDPFSWGSAEQLPTVTTLPAPQRILADIELVQAFGATQIILTPRFGFSSDPLANGSRFPENALVVVQLTFGISDFGGSPLTPFVMSFTTENLPAQSAAYDLEVDGETPFLDDESSMDINSSRAPSRVQGYMLFAGDGDNGANQLRPSLPETIASGCTLDRQPNSGTKDDFDPVQDVLLDTGSTRNTCANQTDGSEAVVWEFRTLRIRNGVTVRVVGVNPAILLVQGDVTIEAGGRLLLRGDALNGAPQGRGGNGFNNGRATTVTAAKGGLAVAGGGSGGDATKPHAIPAYGKDGVTASGSPDGPGVVGGAGAGQGGVSTRHTQTNNPWPSGSSQGGGGGGHAGVGGSATALIAARIALLGTARGAGGAVYPVGPGSDRMLRSEGGGGGGAAGYGDETTATTTFTNGGGAGGAGGGFLDITSAGNINVFGTIDAAGSRGGNGGNDTFYGAGGGGGGAGGGVRLLTPNDIDISGGTITAAGGAGGTATNGTGGGLNGPLNHGGAGGIGRLVMEDADSVIAGQGAATLAPSEGGPGFFRGLFDATRFQGGGLRPQALSDVFAVGPMNPVFRDPVQNPGVQQDFVAGIPTPGAPGIGSTALLIEARGYQMRADGTADPASRTDWFSVGSFRDTGIENLPAWQLGHPGDIVVPADNALDAASPEGHSGSGFGALNGIEPGDGFEFLQLRITVYLPTSVGPFDPGAFLDHWSIRFDHDQ